MKDFEKKNYYELLGVERNATEDEIKQSFKEIAVVYHPDSNFFDEIVPDNDASETDVALFKAITSAYQTLINKDKRAEYDRVLNREDLARGTHQTGDWIRPDGSQVKAPVVPRGKNPTVTDLQKLQKQYQDRLQNRPPPQETRSVAEMMEENKGQDSTFHLKWIIIVISAIIVIFLVLSLIIAR